MGFIIGAPIIVYLISDVAAGYKETRTHIVEENTKDGIYIRDTLIEVLSKNASTDTLVAEALRDMGEVLEDVKDSLDDSTLSQEKLCERIDSLLDAQKER